MKELEMLTVEHSHFKGMGDEILDCYNYYNETQVVKGGIAFYTVIIMLIFYDYLYFLEMITETVICNVDMMIHQVVWPFIIHFTQLE